MRNFLLNCCLAIIVGVLGYSVYGQWSSPQAVELPQRGAKGTRTRRVPAAPKVRLQRALLSQKEYALIVTENLFHPTRKELKPLQAPKQPTKADEDKEKEPGSATPTIVAPRTGKEIEIKDLQLFGTLIYGDELRFALFKRPAQQAAKRARPARGARASRARKRQSPSSARQYKYYKLGDTLGKFRVVGIERDRVILEKDGARSPVLIRDPTKPKTRPKAPAVRATRRAPAAGGKASGKRPAQRARRQPAQRAQEKRQPAQSQAARGRPAQR